MKVRIKSGCCFWHGNKMYREGGEVALEEISVQGKKITPEMQVSKKTMEIVIAPPKKRGRPKKVVE